MSCGGKTTNGWGRSMPLERVVTDIAALWAEHVTRTVPGLMTSQGLPMAPAMATTCTMTFNTGVYIGTSTSGRHAEIHCLDQAHNAGADLSTGVITALTNPVCLLCAAVLQAVGITNVPNLSTDTTEYGNYNLPAWIFDDDGDNGILRGVLGANAWHAWTKHVSATTRSKQTNRSTLVIQTTQLLKKA